MDTDLPLLAANGLEYEAKQHLRTMTADEWRELREAISQLDSWLDDTILERHEKARRTNGLETHR